LIAVGNFLGASRDALSRIAQQQLDIARASDQKLQKLVDLAGSRGRDPFDDLGI
jgi:hypothetical protein